LNWEDVEGRLPEIAMGLSTYGDYLNEEVKPTAGDTARYPRRSTHGMEEKNAECRSGHLVQRSDESGPCMCG